MSVDILRFPYQKARAVMVARACQHVAAQQGWNFSFEECLAIYHESKKRKLTEKGEAIAREIAHQVAHEFGIELRPE